MTVRTAELLMAIATILISLAIMWKSTELSIGWVPRKGPGSGAWPFWLSTGMLLASIATLVRWFLRMTPESRSEETYISRTAAYVVGVSVGALLFLLIATHIVGIYIALLLFLFFYLRFVGRHGWLTTLSITIGVPVFIFCLFEWALTIPLPKAVSEPLFYPIYDLIY
ncbi:MAG: tripartite tricarboxylate transporter TctB family protein [Kiloniellales bacterium]|jgi:putative tricarboxylic transport membrane protein|nr:tripartite tricarboxylate transporter TctB family protein [Kiloniellales bacterium]